MGEMWCYYFQYTFSWLLEEYFFIYFFVHLDFLFSQLPFAHFKNCFDFSYWYVVVPYTFKHIPLLSAAGGFHAAFFFFVPDVPLV